MYFPRVLRALLRWAGYGSEPALDDGEIHRVVGEPARVGTTLPLPGEMRVVSWNIAQGTQFDRVLRVLVDLDADLYALQEVDRECRRSDRRKVARDLAGALDVNWVFAGEFQEIGEGRRGVPALTGEAAASSLRRGPVA